MSNLKHLLVFIIIQILLQYNLIDLHGQADYEMLRRRMVIDQIASRGINDAKIISAMLKVPRHLFVPGNVRPHAYEDRPLSIGEGQTISQPYIVALMSQLLNLKPGMKVLEVGTGSGYQAAILAELNVSVYSIEIIEPLGSGAKNLLDSLGYNNIKVKIGDGFKGWAEFGPFDGIIVTCSPSDIPEPLISQLNDGGIMVIPVGGAALQELVLVTRKKDKIEKKSIAPVLFVPMVSPEGERY